MNWLNIDFSVKENIYKEIWLGVREVAEKFYVFYNQIYNYPIFRKSFSPVDKFWTFQNEFTWSFLLQKLRILRIITRFSVREVLGLHLSSSYGFLCIEDAFRCWNDIRSKIDKYKTLIFNKVG